MQTLITLAMVAICIQLSIAQKFEKTQPDILYAVDKNQDTTNVKVGIRTANPTAPLQVKGEIIADSAIFNGPVKMSSGGESFIWLPNRTSPAPAHDLVRVTTGYFTILGHKPTNGVLLGLGVNTETPSNTMDVNGTARIRTLTGNNQNIATADNTGVLGKIPFTGNATDALLGSGTFGALPVPITAWLLGGNNNINSNLNSINNILGTLDNLDLKLFAGGSQRGKIDWSTGFWGIGPATFNPAHLLDARNGDINTGNGTPQSPQGYMIGSNYVLRHRGVLSNLYVGVDAGAQTPTLSSIENTFVGNEAGMLNLNGDRNTFIGTRAGKNIANGRFNTFIGADAGLNLQSGTSNTFIGEHSGYLQVSGSNNSYFGSHAGQGNPGSSGSNNTFLGMSAGPDLVNGNDNTFSGHASGNFCSTGNRNSFYGKQAGVFTNIGSDNVFMGYRAGWQNRGGNFNTYLGTLAGVSAGVAFQNLNNVSAIGANALATAENTMILGDNTVNVGIGLSDDITPPGNKLELNYSVTGNHLTANAAGGTGFSGLRFRDLKATSTPCTTNPSTGVLSVNTDGDVILVTDQTGGVGGDDYDWYMTTPNPSQFPTGATNNNEEMYHIGQIAVGTTTALSTGVGADQIPVLPAQFHSKATDLAIAGNFENFGANNGDWVIGVRGAIAGGSSSALFAAAVVGEVSEAVGVGYAGAFWGDVLSTTTFTGSWTFPSDKILKQDTASFTHGLNIIRSLNPISFHYNGNAGFDSHTLRHGVHAQELLLSAPWAIDTFYLPLQPTDTFSTLLLSVKSDAIMYTAINAVKQLDSIVTTLLPIPIPAPPTLVSPSNGDTGLVNPVTVVWNTTTNATSYTVALSTDPAFSNSKIVERYITSDTALTLKTSDNTTYYWFVTASNNSGTSTPSETHNFSTQTVIAVPPEERDSIMQAEIDAMQKSETEKTLSDAQLKQNMQPLQNSLQKIKQLEGINFEWNQSIDTSLNLPSGTIPGLVAQQTNTIIPEVVFTDQKGYKHIEYQRFIPYFIEAIKQQQQTIDSLRAQSPAYLAEQITTINQQITAIQNCIDNIPPGMCGGSGARMANPDNNNSKITQRDVILKGEIVLDQNNPNPFKESTTINYFIPEYIHFAQIIFSDNTGRIINTVDIAHTGEGQLNVKAEKLGSGMYSYSIVVDGNVVDTKNMIKTK